MSNISRKLLMEILTCGKMRNIRDQARENVLYSSEVNNLCNILQEVLQSKDPQQNLLAEKYCIVFQRNYCTTNEAERDKLNDQLMKLADAQTSVSLVDER